MPYCLFFWVYLLMGKHGMNGPNLLQAYRHKVTQCRVMRLKIWTLIVLTTPM